MCRILNKPDSRPAGFPENIKAENRRLDSIPATEGYWISRQISAIFIKRNRSVKEDKEEEKKQN